MEHWQWGRELVLWVSLAVNAVLFFLLFFKSAINEIVREWWIRRHRREEENRRYLHELRRHLVAYPSHHFFLMIQAVLAGKARTDRELEKISKSMESGGHRLTEAARLFEIKLLDHIIIGRRTYYSFMDNGKIGPAFRKKKRYHAP